MILCRWALALLLVVLLTGCSSAEQEQLKTKVAQVAATEAAQLKETMVPKVATAAAEAVATLVATQERDAILQRAKAWVDAKVPYNQQGRRDGYRTDCSGFVSYAWQLPKPGPDTTRFVSGGHAIEIPIEELQPGDALNNKLAGNSGHIVLFVGWLNVERTRFQAYDMNTNPGYASSKEFTLKCTDTHCTIAELEPWARGPYYAQCLASLP